MSFDLLVLTSPEFENSVKELSNKFNIKINTMAVNLTTIFQAACARLNIFSYANIDSYKKILYLDTDIIIKGELAPLFDIDLDDLLYGIEQGTIASPNFGSKFFNLKHVNQETTGLNSGTLLFNNSHIIRDLFSRIRGHINAFTDSELPAPYCMDQPFINYHSIRDNLYNNKVLNKYVSLYEDNITVSNFSTSLICHFSYPIGNFGHKYTRMTSFLVDLLNSNASNTTTSDDSILASSILNKKYCWGKGFIKFKNANLETFWGEGAYKVKNNTVLANWRGFNHILQFNSDYTEYYAIRIYPLDCSYSVGKYIVE